MCFPYLILLNKCANMHMNFHCLYFFSTLKSRNIIWTVTVHCQRFVRYHLRTGTDPQIVSINTTMPTAFSFVWQVIYSNVLPHIHIIMVIPSASYRPTIQFYPLHRLQWTQETGDFITISNPAHKFIQGYLAIPFHI